MLIPNLCRGLRSTLRVDARLMSSKPMATKPVIKDAREKTVVEIQAEALDKDICLLVDEKDNIIGSATKRFCHTVRPDGTMPLHRAFSVFMFNKRGDMLLQRRTSEKIVYPDYYSCAVCGHPLLIDNQPEEIVAASRRRINFELGIPLEEMEPHQFTIMTRIHYEDPGDGVWGENELDYILILQTDAKIKPNPDEIQEHYYIPKNEFNTFMSTLKGPTTPYFNMIRRYRLKLWWDNLHRLNEIAEPDKIRKFQTEDN